MSSRDYYETYWSPEGFLPKGPLNETVWRLIEHNVTPATTCIDVGCGDGLTYGRWVSDRARQYAGVDVSANAVARARANGLDATVVEGAAHLPHPADSFDVALCIEVFEHLFEPHLAAREILRVLRPGGRLIATVPNVAYWRRRTDLLLFGRWNPLGDDLSVEQPWRDPHIRFFTPSTFRRMLVLAGFAPIAISGHDGALLREIPRVRELLRAQTPSRLFARLESRFPSLLGRALHAVAVKPTQT